MIIKMNHLNMKDFNKSNEGFMVSGRIIPTLENNVWSYTDEIDISYIEDDRKAVFFYYVDNNCAGQIKLRSNWNGYGLIEDIAVKNAYRKNGVGTALINKAMEWAKENNLCGLMLETQDINVSACYFYAKNNFVIGAVDTMLYSNFPSANELAIFWYYKF